MARSGSKRKTVVRIAKNVPFGGKGTRPREMSIASQGRPMTPVEQQTFTVVPKPVYRKQKVTMLQKRDVSKGLTMPEADNMTTAHGVVTGDSGGYKGGVRTINLTPAVSPKAGTNQRVIPAPSPTSRAGVRSPFNAKVKVGKTAKNTRFNKN